MSIIKARVVTELKAVSRSIPALPASPAITDNGTLDFICGTRSTVLVRRVNPYLAINKILLGYPHCHRCNDIEKLNISLATS